jgi:hypothetical protein
MGKRQQRAQEEKTRRKGQELPHNSLLMMQTCLMACHVRRGRQAGKCKPNFPSIVLCSERGYVVGIDIFCISVSVNLSRPQSRQTCQPADMAAEFGIVPPLFGQIAYQMG